VWWQSRRMCFVRDTSALYTCLLSENRYILLGCHIQNTFCGHTYRCILLICHIQNTFCGNHCSRIVKATRRIKKKNRKCSACDDGTTECVLYATNQHYIPVLVLFRRHGQTRAFVTYRTHSAGTCSHIVKETMTTSIYWLKSCRICSVCDKSAMMICRLQNTFCRYLLSYSQGDKDWYTDFHSRSFILTECVLYATNQHYIPVLVLFRRQRLTRTFVTYRTHSAGTCSHIVKETRTTSIYWLRFPVFHTDWDVRDEHQKANNLHEHLNRTFHDKKTIANTNISIILRVHTCAVTHELNRQISRTHVIELIWFRTNWDVRDFSLYAWDLTIIFLIHSPSLSLILIPY